MFKHLKENNITYLNHLKRAIKYSIKLGISSIKCFIHGILPCCFEDAATKTCKDILNNKD